MTIERWHIDPVLKKEAEEHYKTIYSLSLVDKDPLEIARLLTFDGLPKKITTEDLTKFLTSIDQLFLGGDGLKGMGLEVGSGPGTFVAALAQQPKVERMYGVEFCESIVETLMSKVSTHIAGAHDSKIVGAVGDFNALELPDQSVDFVFDFFSLHHSVDPSQTLRELYRVLKPQGVIICVDKARADSMSDADLEALLNIEYTPQMKLSMGIPVEKYHIRRMNGENEYRLKDWKRHFKNTGFSVVEHYNVAKRGGNLIGRFIKNILALLPPKMQTKVTPFISRTVTNNLEPTNRIFTDIFPAYPREFSLMFAWKE